MTHKFTIQQTEFRTTPGIRAVREQVFIQEQHVPEGLEWDGLDDAAIHVVAQDKHAQVIGTARLLKDGHICRMAVLPEWRHQGVGSAMLKELLLIAQQRQLPKVFLHAQTTAIGFYERHGFHALGEEFMDAGIPHRHMERNLP
jgi:predicted GNAT family N-acyltransferase